MNGSSFRALALGVLTTLPVTLIAQGTEAVIDTELAAAGDVTGEIAEIPEPLSIVDQWAADPTRIFDAAELSLDDFIWIARPIVVFADSPFDPNFQRQLDLLTAEIDRLVERDVIVVVDTNPDDRTDIRLRLRPRGFMMAIIGKDGEVELRKPLPWDVREISRSIDKMPLRQQEIDDRRGG